MDFLGRSRSSQEPNHLHGVMSFFFFSPPPLSSPPRFVCFPVLAFGLLFVSYHVGLYLIIVLLFLCQQFIPLPCHLIMCVLTVCWCGHHPFLRIDGVIWVIDLCRCVFSRWDYCSGKYTSSGTLGGLSSEGQAQADISVFLSVSLTLPVSLVLLPCPFFSHFAQLVQNNTFCPSSLLFLSRSPTSSAYSPALGSV